MTRNTQTSIYDALKEIAGMMIEDGYTAAEVTAVADGLRQIKSSLWDEERETGKDLGTKMIGGNAWILDKVAMYMETYYDDNSRTDEDEVIVSRKCAEIIDPIYYNDDDDNNDNNDNNDDNDDNTAPAAAPDLDDSWKDHECFSVIHAIDNITGNKVVARPTTWREKLEMEDQLHEDGYEFVDVAAMDGETVTLWYRPMMPWPKLREMTQPSTSTEEE